MSGFEELKESILSIAKGNQKILEEIRQIQNPSERWLDITEACSWLKCSTRTLQKYRDEGKIPFSQISAKIYFRLSDLQEFLNRHNTSYINK
uniref:helix-turn-helix domain-containing protein n=1 Tax=uncultured Draconibacterium sp. TaxID=1573823 RepID=UPI003216C756